MQQGIKSGYSLQHVQHFKEFKDLESIIGNRLSMAHNTQQFEKYGAATSKIIKL